MNFKLRAKQNRAIRESYYFALYTKNWLKSRFKLVLMMLFSSADFKLIYTLKQRIEGLFPKSLNITNKMQNYYGKNIIGYPAMSQLMKDGEMVGWAETTIQLQNHSLPFLQLKTDVEKNFPAIWYNLGIGYK